MFRRQMFFALPLLALAVTACERAATDPSLVVEQLARLDRTAPANTLPALFNEALTTAQRRNGPNVLSELADEWQARQAEVQAAYSARDMAAVQARLSALRAEEIRVILAVMGPEVVHRVLDHTTAGLVTASSRIIEATQRGVDTRAAENAVRDVNALVSLATAFVSTDAARALLLATEAATQVAAINDMTVDLGRLRGVDELFPEIVATLPHDQLRNHARLNGEAQAALRAGQRAVATEKLDAVRAEEIRLVLLATADRASGELVNQVGGAIAELRTALLNQRDSNRDIGRARRMLTSATDLYNRSKTAEAAGDHATALDLASHAAGLLNSLRHIITK